MPFSRLTTACLLLVLAAGMASCGYHVAGRGRHLPAEWKTIAVVALENHTRHYRIEQRLTEALVRELLARTKYRVTSDAESADAVLRGEVTGIDSSAILFDTATGRATTVVVSVTLRVRLLDRATGRAVYENSDFLFREQYEISTNIEAFFDEQEPALERLARDFAATLVAALLEAF